jgi:hypothetical protein
VESPFHFPDMDRLSAPADQAIKEPASPDFAAPTISLTPLPTIPGCTILRPRDADYAAHVRVYNARTQIAPALFAICSTEGAVSGVFSWVKANNLPLKDAGIRISMDGRGRWMDNVFIERLWRSLVSGATSTRVYLMALVEPQSGCEANSVLFSPGPRQ